MRSGLEAGAEDVSVSDLIKDQEAGLHEGEDKAKRKNAQVSLIFEWPSFFVVLKIPTP